MPGFEPRFPHSYSPSLSPVARVLGDLALPVALAVVAQLLPDGPLEESLAALTTDGPVVAT